MEPPKYARIGITEMIWKPSVKKYYRPAGQWSIEIEEVDGKLITKYHPCNTKLKGLPVIAITKEEYREGNKGYL
jgi:hypothetical protein